MAAVSVAATGAGPAVAAPAGEVAVEGEAFVASHNLGGLAIQPAYCGGASGYYLADGLDVIGEWIELPITLPLERCYGVTIGFQGYEGFGGSARLIVLDGTTHEEVMSREFTYFGAGIG